MLPLAEKQSSLNKSTYGRSFLQRLPRNAHHPLSFTTEAYVSSHQGPNGKMVSIDESCFSGFSVGLFFIAYLSINFIPITNNINSYLLLSTFSVEDMVLSILRDYLI